MVSTLFQTVCNVVTEDYHDAYAQGGSVRVSETVLTMAFSDF